jgi:hypothetical protein
VELYKQLDAIAEISTIMKSWQLHQVVIDSWENGDINNAAFHSIFGNY